MDYNRKLLTDLEQLLKKDTRMVSGDDLLKNKIMDWRFLIWQKMKNFPSLNVGEILYSIKHTIRYMIIKETL